MLPNWRPATPCTLWRRLWFMIEINNFVLCLFALCKYFYCLTVHAYSHDILLDKVRY